MSEHDEQAKVCQYLDFLGLLYFAVPNGMYLGENKTRAYMTINSHKKIGFKKGVPDLVICEPNKDYHGLFIEMKNIKNGVLDENQKKWLDKLNKKGYLSVCCRGFEEAKKVIDEYINIKERVLL